MAEAVAGPYDVIARAGASSLDMLARLVVRQIQDVEGVTRILTCPIVRLYGHCSDTRDEAESGMYIVQANGWDLHRISSDPSTGRLAWSPDGTTIAYVRHVRDETSSSMYLINADGSGRHELASGATSPSWSADGLVLAAVRDGQVIFLDLEGNQLASLDAAGLHASSVAWVNTE